MKTQCNICKEILPDFSAAAEHVAVHEPTVRKPTQHDPLFRVGWKKDGTIRQPRNMKVEVDK